jgi:DNA-binding response OmpR family regulator
MLSGLSASGDQDAGLAAGAVAYMTKPFYLDDFLTHLRALLRSRQA